MVPVSVNPYAVLTCSLVVFMLGGAWYSPFMFARPWVALLGKESEELRKGSNPLMFVVGFLTGLISCYILAIMVRYSGAESLSDGALVGFICWLGFAGATSYNNQVNFVQKPRALWAIDSGYNLVSFVIAGAVLGIWQ
jgi:hypothetical protein